MRKSTKIYHLFMVAIGVLVNTSAFAQCVGKVRGTYVKNASEVVQFAIDTTGGGKASGGDYNVKYYVDTNGSNFSIAYGFVDTTTCTWSYNPLRAHPGIDEYSYVLFSPNYDTIYAVYWTVNIYTKITSPQFTDVFARNPTGINNISNQEATIKVYPNPNKGTFTIEVNGESSNDKVQVGVYDILGQQVYSQETTLNSSLQVDLGGKAAGIYFYRVMSATGDKLIAVGKVVVQK